MDYLQKYLYTKSRCKKVFLLFSLSNASLINFYTAKLIENKQQVNNINIWFLRDVFSFCLEVLGYFEL